MDDIFVNHMELTIYSAGYNLPPWLYRWPFQDGDLRLVRKVARFFGINLYSPPITLLVEKINVETNTIWFTSPLPSTVKVGDYAAIKR